MEAQDPHALIAEVRAALTALPQDNPKPLALHRCGVAFQVAHQHKAYRVEKCENLEQFCAALRREFPRCSVETTRQYLRIAAHYTSEQLQDVTLSKRSLLIILKAPPEHRGELLSAAHLDPSILNPLEDARTADKREEAVAAILQSAFPPGPRSAARLIQEHLGALSRLLGALRAPPPELAPQLLRDHRDLVDQILHRVITEPSPSAPSSPGDRRETPRQDPAETRSEPPGPTRPRLRRGRFCLPVPLPLVGDLFDDGQRPPSPAEAEAAACLVLLHDLEASARVLVDLPLRERWPALPDLELALNRAIHAHNDLTRPMLSTLAPIASVVEQELSALAAREPPVPFDHLLTLPHKLIVAPEGAVPLQEYVVFDGHDPLPDPLPDPRACDLLAFRLIGLLAALQRRLPRLWTLLGEGHPFSRPLFYQLHHALGATRAHFCGLLSFGAPHADQAREHERARLAHFQQLRDDLEKNLVVLGDNFIPPQYIIIGRTRDGRFVAISAFTPQLLIGLGTQGWGKSHLAVLLAEACVLRIPGLGRLPAPPRAVWFASDWSQGLANHQALCAFQPNPYGDQRRLLQQVYGVRGQHAYEGGTLLCLPGSRERLLTMYPDLHERGLDIVEARLHEDEHDHFTLAQFLYMGLSGISGSGRTQAHNFVDSLIASEGPGLSPRRLHTLIYDAPIDARPKAAFLQQLALMDQLTTRQEHLIDRLQGDGPLIFLLESRHHSRQAMLALEMIFLNVLSKPLRSGADPMRWMFMDELSKRAATGKSGEALKEIGSELRHRPTSFYGSGQLVGDMPPDFLGLPTIYGQFHMGSRKEFKKVQGQVAGFEDVPFEQVRALPRGSALFIAARASDPLFTQVPQEVLLRPSCVHAGGETLTAL